MGKDSESWLHHRRPDGQFPNVETSKLPFDLGMQNTHIPCAIPCTDAAPTNCTSPAFGFSGLPNFNPGQLKEPHGWFYCLPRFRQGLIQPDMMTPHSKPLPEFNLHSKVSSSDNGNCGETITNAPIARGPKQFIVFDQTGNKTTMIFSSEIGTPIQRLNSWSPKPIGGCCNVSGDELGIGSDEHYHSEPNLTDEFDGINGSNEGSDSHEDTEEINALLYSDDEENCSDDDGEETSTGHSPSSMTAFEKQEWFEDEGMDEVASSTGPLKRKKLSNGGYEVPTLMDTASSINPKNRSFECEDDAESSCAGGEPERFSDQGSLSGNKRVRREKIRETVNVLQTIIPDGKGKDAVMVLDEAISYLRTLKFKAKSLGLSAL